MMDGKLKLESRPLNKMSERNIFPNYKLDTRNRAPTLPRQHIISLAH